MNNEDIGYGTYRIRIRKMGTKKILLSFLLVLVPIGVVLIVFTVKGF